MNLTVTGYQGYPVTKRSLYRIKKYMCVYVMCGLYIFYLARRKCVVTR